MWSRRLAQTSASSQEAEVDVDHLRRVDIIMEEYKTLREEVLMRVQTRFQLLGLGGGVIAFVTSQDSDDRLRTLAGGFLVLLAVWFWLSVGIRRCTGRILEIETEVNGHLGPPGALCWEKRQTERPRHQRLIS